MSFVELSCSDYSVFFECFSVAITIVIPLSFCCQLCFVIFLIFCTFSSLSLSLYATTALQVAGDGPAGLLAILRHHDVADQDSLIRLRRLNVSTASHLSFLTVSAMLEAGFNRVQARKLEIIGMQAREAERRRAMVLY